MSDVKTNCGDRDTGPPPLLRLHVLGVATTLKFEKEKKIIFHLSFLFATGTILSKDSVMTCLSILIIRSKQMVRQVSAVLYRYTMIYDCKAVAVLVEIDDLAYLRQTGNA